MPNHPAIIVIASPGVGDSKVQRLYERQAEDRVRRRQALPKWVNGCSDCIKLGVMCPACAARKVS